MNILLWESKDIFRIYFKDSSELTWITKIQISKVERKQTTDKWSPNLKEAEKKVHEEVTGLEEVWKASSTGF